MPQGKTSSKARASNKKTGGKVKRSKKKGGDAASGGAAKKSSSASKGLTKSQLMAEIAEKVEMTKQSVVSVFDALEEIASKELKAGRSVMVPGMAKFAVKVKKATPARQGRNPSTGEAMTISAKPARKVVRARVQKSLKEVV